MAKRISSLSVVLGATVGPFVGGITKAREATSGLFSSVSGLAGSMLKLTGIGGLVGAALGGLGFGAMIRGQAEAIDSAAKLSDRLGISTEALASLTHAADLSGVSTESLTGGLEKYLKTVAGAAGGNKALAEGFSALGLDASKLVNMPTDQAIGLIGDALNAIENPAQRASAAVAIFGKSGQGLLPLLAEGSDGLGAFREEAKALGLTFSRLDASKVEEANDSISRVGAVATGVFRQITIALAPFISRIAGAATAIGIKIVAGVQYALPIVSSVAGRIWGIITGVFGAIWSYVGPIVSAIGGVIASSWQATVASSVSFAASIWSVVTSVFGAIWPLVTTVAGGISLAWSWAMNLLGVTTADTGSTVANVFSGIVSTVNWVRDVVTTVFTIIGYSITNWRDVVGLAMSEVGLFFVRTANQIVYQLGTVVPALLAWFANNWRDILQTVYNFTTTVFSNMWSNVTSFFSGVWSYLSGGGAKFEWKGLTDGFEATLKELPDIAEREIGGLEQSLAAQTDAMRNSVGKGLGDALAQNRAIGEGAAKSIASAIGDLPGITVPEVEKIPPITSPFEIDTEDADAKLDKTQAKAESAKSSISNIASGSAEQMQRMALAAAPTSAIAEATAAPVSTATKSAMRESATASAGKSGTFEALLAKVTQILAELKTMDRLELAEAV